VASPDTEARAQAASDIYRALPEKERAEISAEMARRVGSLWFGSPTTPDEEAASQPVYAPTLAGVLGRYGYLTTDRPHGPAPSAPTGLVEAKAAPRSPVRDDHHTDRVPVQSGPVGIPLQVPPRSPDAAMRQGPQPRIT
jgi:hypothetical protein